MVFEAAIDAKVGFILGLTNLIGLVLVLLSCRCMLRFGIFKNSLQQRFYQRFYNFHCYFWWFFIVSVALHAIFTLAAHGIPV